MFPDEKGKKKRKNVKDKAKDERRTSSVVCASKLCRLRS